MRPPWVQSWSDCHVEGKPPHTRCSATLNVGRGEGADGPHSNSWHLVFLQPSPPFCFGQVVVMTMTIVKTCGEYTYTYMHKKFH